MKNEEAAKMTTEDVRVLLWSTIRGYKGEPPIPNLFSWLGPQHACPWRQGVRASGQEGVVEKGMDEMCIVGMYSVCMYIHTYIHTYIHSNEEEQEQERGRQTRKNPRILSIRRVIEQTIMESHPEIQKPVNLHSFTQPCMYMRCGVRNRVHTYIHT